jgi:hypothetical protein
VECPRCAFPWVATRIEKGFDWAPDHSMMGTGSPPGWPRRRTPSTRKPRVAKRKPARRR